MLKRTVAAVAASSSLVLAVPTAAQAMAPNTPEAGTPDFNGSVESVVHRGDTVYVAGGFSSVTSNGRTYDRDGVAAFDIDSGAVKSWSPRVDGSVHKVLVAKEGVYLVGDFTAVNGQRRRDVARVSRVGGVVDTSFRHSSNGAVHAIALSKRKVYLGGEFTRFDGRDRGQLAAVSRRGGSDLLGWKPQTSQGPVTDLVRKRAGVYVGGFFHRINGTDRDFLALVTNRKGSLVRSFKSRVPNVVLDIHTTRKRVYAGTGGRTNGGGAVSVRRGNGERVFHRRFDGDVQAITTMNGVVYVGGHFTAICERGGSQNQTGACEGGAEATRYRGASLDGDGDLTGWHPNINPNVSDVPGIEAFSTFAGSDGLAIGGGFTSVNGVQAERFAFFN